MKKGMSSQVFIYIFLAIVMALILFFGFKQIAGLTELSDKSTYVVFKNDFTEAVDKLFYKNQGSTVVFSPTSRNKPLVLPKGITNICFEGSEVKLLPKKYDDFEIENLRGDVCMVTTSGRLSFNLENVIVSDDVKIEVSEI